MMRPPNARSAAVRRLTRRRCHRLASSINASGVTSGGSTGFAGIGVRGGATLISASINSTLLESKLDPTDSLPLFEQVAAEIRRAIADGEIGPGERLPPARALAAVLEVNANTVF